MAVESSVVVVEVQNFQTVFPLIEIFRAAAETVVAVSGVVGDAEPLCRIVIHQFFNDFKCLIGHIFDGNGAVVFFQITDPKLYAYGVENPIMAIENLTATTLRNIIGDLELDETLTSREIINTKMRVSLDVATDPWGIKVNRVELKNIIPPAAIQDAMEKQMKAERERREAILIAEGEKKSTILVAEGKKESAILDAQAEKEAAILRAEAKREATIKEAEGQAEAILIVQKANADGIRFLNEADPSNQVITIKSLEAFAKAADGKATKIIIPSEIQGVAGLAKSLTEVVKEDK